jgi:hypothetical protein
VLLFIILLSITEAPPADGTLAEAKAVEAEPILVPVLFKYATLLA